MRWYSEVHIPDMCRIPGVVRCTLYKVSDNQYGISSGKYPYAYVNNLEMETDDFYGAAYGDGKAPDVRRECMVRRDRRRPMCHCGARYRVGRCAIVFSLKLCAGGDICIL